MDRMIEKVVKDLPHLRQLRLDGSEFFAWGDVVKWEKVVEDRYNKRAEALALKEIEKRRLANEAAGQ
jgi:heme oxygenase